MEEPTIRVKIKGRDLNIYFTTLPLWSNKKEYSHCKLCDKELKMYQHITGIYTDGASHHENFAHTKCISSGGLLSHINKLYKD